MTTFNPEAFGPGFAALLREPRLAPLGPGSPNEAVRADLQGADDDRLFAPHQVRDQAMAAACRAGLWLHHDFLEEAHAISQQIATAEGSYWHALMHRREPDPDNSKYWFRRVGDHPLFALLAQEAQGLGLQLRSDRWDPYVFIDQCEMLRGTGTEREMLLRQVQQREWELLFGWCYTHTVEAC